MNNNYKLSLQQITLITAVPTLLITASLGNSLITRIVLDIIIAGAGYATARILKKDMSQAIPHGILFGAAVADGILLGAAIAAGYSLFRLVINLTAFVLSRKIIGLALFVTALIVIIRYKKTGKFIK